jgi:hypothetical protein
MIKKITVLNGPSKNLIKQMAQSFQKGWKEREMSGYSETVDQQFKSTAIFIHENNHLISHYDIVDSGKNYFSPITSLPALVSFKDGTEKIFPQGIRNNKEELDKFINTYTPQYKQWGEGRLFYSSSQDHTKQLIKAGYKVLAKQNWDGIFALAENNSKMGTVLKKSHFITEEGHINTITFLSGKLKSANNEIIDVPAFTQKNKPLAWKLFLLKKSNLPR